MKINNSKLNYCLFLTRDWMKKKIVYESVLFKLLGVYL